MVEILGRGAEGRTGRVEVRDRGGMTKAEILEDTQRDEQKIKGVRSPRAVSLTVNSNSTSTKRTRLAWIGEG